MAAFTTRVELHSAIYQDYVTLHAAMERRNFSRTIRGDNGRTYHLPTAEYVSSGNIDRMGVLALAQAAVRETGKSGSILVTEATAWQWDNLPSV
jgi:hypothetical protein